MIQFIYIDILFQESIQFYRFSKVEKKRISYKEMGFIRDKCIASKIGTGQFYNDYGVNGNIVTAGQRDYAAWMQNIEAQKEEY